MTRQQQRRVGEQRRLRRGSARTAGSGHGAVDSARTGLERGAADRRGRPRAGVHGRAGRAGGAPPPGRMPKAGAACRARRRPAPGAGARRADAPGGHAAAAGAAKRRAAAVLRARHGVPERRRRVPRPPVLGNPDG